eukprot:scpid86460/ scgid32653/ 
MFLWRIRYGVATHERSQQACSSVQRGQSFRRENVDDSDITLPYSIPALYGEKRGGSSVKHLSYQLYAFENSLTGKHAELSWTSLYGVTLGWVVWCARCWTLGIAI